MSDVFYEVPTPARNCGMTAVCVLCDTPHTVYVRPADAVAYGAGQLVQDVWPDMTASQREVVIGHRAGCYVCDACSSSSVYSEE